MHLKAREMSGMSYIEIVKWENEYRSEEQITMARTEIFSSYDLLHQNSILTHAALVYTGILGTKVQKNEGRC